MCFLKSLFHFSFELIIFLQVIDLSKTIFEYVIASLSRLDYFWLMLAILLLFLPFFEILYELIHTVERIRARKCSYWLLSFLLLLSLLQFSQITTMLVYKSPSQPTRFLRCINLILLESLCWINQYLLNISEIFLKLNSSDTTRCFNCLSK